MASISDIKSQLNQFRQHMKTFMATKQLNIGLDLTFNSLNVNSSLNETIITSFEHNLIQQINDLKDIKDLGIDLTNRSTDDLNQNNVSIGCQRSDERLEVLSDIQEVPEVISSDNESEEDFESHINIDFHLKEETIDGNIVKNEDTIDRQSCDVLSQSEDNTIPEVIESNIDSEDGIESHINNDWQQNHKTIDECIDENEDTIDRQEIQTNEDKSVSNETQSNTELETNEDNDRQTEDIDSDEEVGDESDTAYRRVKPVKASEDKYVCDFKDCGKSYGYKCNLRTHRKSHSGKRYFCDHKKCVKHFAHPKGLYRHKKSATHVLGHSFTCCVFGCNYQTKHKDQLERHITSHPISDHNIQRHDKTIDGKYECEFIGCLKKFKYSHTMLKHKRIHLNHTYRCDINDCDQTFTTHDHLRRHECRQHSTKYRCPRKGCDYKTGDNYYYNIHLKSHSNERQFKCLINNCDKSFKLKSHLTSHQLLVHPNHLPDIPWIQCTYTGCDYKTKYKHNLTQHSKRHSK